MDLVSDINIENAGPLPTGRVPAKSHKKHHKPHDDCQNCGAILVGEHCHECGQHGHVHRSVLHVIEEVIHGITHLDSRAWRSLPMLAFRPGTLTRSYVMGKRARYVPPFAMFLFSIFAMFLAFAFSGGPGLVSKASVTKAELVEQAREVVAERQENVSDAEADVREAQKEVADLRAATDTQPGELGAAVGQIGAANGRLASAKAQLDRAKAALAASIAKPESVPAASDQGAATPKRIRADITFGDDSGSQQALEEIAAEKAKATSEGNLVEANVLGAVEKLATEQQLAEAKKSAPTQKSAKTPSESPGSNQIKIRGEDFGDMLVESMRKGTFILTPWPHINEKIKKKTANPELFLYKLQNTAYKFSFLLVPLSLPFIWIMLFWKKNVTMFDHAVFALYSLSFVTFLFMFISLSGHWISTAWGFGAAAIIIPIHIFYQFKGAYQLKWFSAFWRTFLFCTISSWTIMSTFFIVIITLGVTG